MSMSKIRQALVEPVASQTKCAYCDWLLTLDADDRAAIVEFYDSSLTTSEIIRRLEPFGLPVTHHPFQQHRRGRHRELV